MSETLLSEKKSATACVCKPCPWLAAATLARREWVRFVRQRGRVLGAVGQPLIFWLLFGIGLGPAFRPGAAGLSYLQYFFPGSLVLILLFTAIFATISLIEDRREGFLQAVLVAPVPRWSMVLGKVLGATAIATAQGLLFLALGLTVGVAFSATMLLATVALILIVSFALASLGMIIAWRMDSTQGFHAVMSLLLMPMWLLSGAFFPAPAGGALAWGPWLLAWVMRLNPLTYGVAALQRLLWEGQAGTLPGGVPSAAVAWSVTIAFAAAAFALACHGAPADQRRPVMNGRAVKYWLALLAVTGAIYGSSVAWRAYRPPPAKPAAPPAVSYKFELVDQLGRPFDSERLKGKVWVANFFFTNCPALCRTTNQQLSVLFRGKAAHGVQFVSLTCDPLTDTPDVLKVYSRAFTGEPDRWAFVTGKFDQIAALATNFFKVALEPKGHSDRCFIVDRAGKVRGNFYVTEPGKLELMEKLLATVVAEK